jgi:hypothetical protein
MLVVATESMVDDLLFEEEGVVDDVLDASLLKL